MVGRSIATYLMFAFRGVALGSYVWGTIADYAGTSFSLYIAAGLLVIATIAGTWLPIASVTPDCDDDTI